MLPIISLQYHPIENTINSFLSKWELTIDDAQNFLKDIDPVYYGLSEDDNYQDQSILFKDKNAIEGARKLKKNIPPPKSLKIKSPILDADDDERVENQTAEQKPTQLFWPAAVGCPTALQKFVSEKEKNHPNTVTLWSFVHPDKTTHTYFIKEYKDYRAHDAMGPVFRMEHWVRSPVHNPSVPLTLRHNEYVNALNQVERRELSRIYGRSLTNEEKNLLSECYNQIKVLQLPQRKHLDIIEPSARQNMVFVEHIQAKTGSVRLKNSQGEHISFESNRLMSPETKFYFWRKPFNAFFKALIHDQESTLVIPLKWSHYLNSIFPGVNAASVFDGLNRVQKYNTQKGFLDYLEATINKPQLNELNRNYERLITLIFPKVFNEIELHPGVLLLDFDNDAEEIKRRKRRESQR